MAVGRLPERRTPLEVRVREVSELRLPNSGGKVPDTVIPVKLKCTTAVLETSQVTPSHELAQGSGPAFHVESDTVFRGYLPGVADDDRHWELRERICKDHT